MKKLGDDEWPDEIEEISKSEKLESSVPGKTRVMFDFSDESLKKLDALVKEKGCGTRAEIIRDALTLYVGALEITRPRNQESNEKKPVATTNDPEIGKISISYKKPKGFQYIVLVCIIGTIAGMAYALLSNIISRSFGVMTGTVAFVPYTTLAVAGLTYSYVKHKKLSAPGAHWVVSNLAGILGFLMAYCGFAF